MGVAHGGLAALWAQAGRASPDESALSRCQHAIALSDFEPDDRHRRRQRMGVGALCVASAARRIGRLGGGTERCVEHLFYPADALGVRLLRAEAAEGRESRVESRRQFIGPRPWTLASRLLAG